MKSDKKKALRKELVVKSKTDNLSKIRDFLFTAAKEIGFTSDAIDNMTLAVDEACTNIIKHAYKSHPDGEIIIRLLYAEGKLTITIIDYGTAFEPDTIPPPDLKKYYQQHRVGGLGMYLMKTLMDEVKYVSIPGKYNQVLLSKNLNTPG
ncbi:MAG: ATP-binding protein [Ignavibacteriales bacterium]|nr:MAG: ATP-binding protein [Ignavibacteriales bacterium]